MNIKVDEKGKGIFSIRDGEQQVAEIVVDVSGNDLTVFHTEVIPDYEGEVYQKNCCRPWWSTRETII